MSLNSLWLLLLSFVSAILGSSPPKIFPNGECELGLITDPSLKGGMVKFIESRGHSELDIIKDEHQYVVGVPLRKNLAYFEVYGANGKYLYTTDRQVANASKALVIYLSSSGYRYQSY